RLLDYSRADGFPGTQRGAVPPPGNLVGELRHPSSRGVSAAGDRLIIPGHDLALGVLRPFPRLVLAVFFTLYFPRVARNETGPFQHLPKPRVELQEGAGYAVPDGGGLGAVATPAHIRHHVILPLGLGYLERLLDDHPHGLATEVLSQWFVIHCEDSLTGEHPDPRHRALPFSGPPIFRLPFSHAPHAPRENATGCWAVCG